MNEKPTDRPPVAFPAPGWWSTPTIRRLRGAPADERGNRRSEGPPDAAVRAAEGVLADLVAHGWGIGGDDARGELTPPPHGADPHAEKVRVQRQLAEERRRQLSTPASAKFVRGMHAPRLNGGSLVSIASLMRDGEQLSHALSAAGTDLDSLAQVVRPYLQLIQGKERCARTGLVLRDVWRYFRHTWATPYRATPGRGMAALIRDGAVEPHPVIGIALIGSAASQIAVRDAWIGWSAKAVISECRVGPSQARVDWIQRTLLEELGELHVEDLLADGLLGPDELRVPTAKTLERLRAEAMLRREEHRRFSSAAEMKRAVSRAKGDPAAWRRIARAPLNRAKRCELLSSLLAARRAIDTFGEINVRNLPSFSRTRGGRIALTTLARRSKARRMGVSIGEIAVCGAVAPYRDLLGGKLVALLMMSPQVRVAYAGRYEQAESVIASAMAARPIVRIPALALLMTTSLYGSGSSQYNRVRLPGTLGETAAAELRYIELGLTIGFGSSQFGDQTIEALSTLISQMRDGRRINSVFGEGVNPRLRKAREGLELLGLPPDALLEHGSPRLVYAVPIAENMKRFLQGLETEPVWSIAGEPQATTECIADWWRRRWLAGRIGRPGVLAAIEQHTLDRPLRHGAQVVLPEEAATLAGLFGV